MSAAAAPLTEPDITWDEAQAMLRRSEDRFQRGAVDELVSRYAEDIVIRYADLPEIRGRAAATRFMRARFAKQRNYRLQKVLFSVSGQKIANTWTGSWEDAETGRQMAGTGVEILELQRGQVIRWEAASTSGKPAARLRRGISSWDEPPGCAHTSLADQVGDRLIIPGYRSRQAPRERRPDPLRCGSGSSSTCLQVHRSAAKSRRWRAVVTAQKAPAHR